MFSLQEKKAIVTGAGSGIGRSIATTFAAAGADVYIVDLNEQSAIEVQQVIIKAGGLAHAISCNVSDSVEVERTFQTVLDDNPLDILVNSAGISHIGKLETTAPDDFDRLFHVNVKGVYNCMRSAVPLLKKSGGVILNLASIAATTGIADRFAYSMTKGAVLSMTLSVARDYIKERIRCNCISPARIHTPFVDNFLAKNYPGNETKMFEQLSAAQPIGRMGTPEEVAALALYLCSDEASFITGCDYPLDGGFTRLK